MRKTEIKSVADGATDTNRADSRRNTEKRPLQNNPRRSQSNKHERAAKQAANSPQAESRLSVASLTPLTTAMTGRSASAETGSGCLSHSLTHIHPSSLPINCNGF